MANKKLVTFLNGELTDVDSNAQDIDFATVNGRTIATDGANLDAHIADHTNPHAVTAAQVGLGNVANVAQIPLSYLDTDNTLTANSDLKVPSQKAIKAYVAAQVGATGAFSDAAFRVQSAGDATKQIALSASAIATGTVRTISMPDANVNLGLVASALQTSQLGAALGVASLDGSGKIPTNQLPTAALGALSYKGTLDASGAAYPASPAKGDYYVISVAGTIAGHAYAVGDWATYDGSAWDYIDNSQKVSSVFGRVGAVVAVSGDYNTSQVTENTNLYYTQARFDAALAAKSTANLAEGSNLYFTNARVIAAPLTGYVSGAGTLAATDSVLQAFQKLNGNIALKQDAATAVTSVNSVTPTSGNVVLTTANIAEGSNLYYTQARFDSAFSAKSTSNLAEGTNLYFTAARAKAAAVANSISAGVTDVAPSEDAVNSALALKQNLMTASLGVKIVGVDIERDDALAFTNDNASSITARQVVYLKSNGNVDLALDSTASLSVKMIGMVEAASIAAAASGKISVRDGAVISGFSGLTPGAPVYIGPTAGATTQTPPTASGTQVYQLGMAISASQMIFRPRHIITNA